MEMYEEEKDYVVEPTDGDPPTEINIRTDVNQRLFYHQNSSHPFWTQSLALRRADCS